MTAARRLDARRFATLRTVMIRYLVPRQPRPFPVPRAETTAPPTDAETLTHLAADRGITPSQHVHLMAAWLRPTSSSHVVLDPWKTVDRATQQDLASAFRSGSLTITVMPDDHIAAAIGNHPAAIKIAHGFPDAGLLGAFDAHESGGSGSQRRLRSPRNVSSRLSHDDVLNVVGRNVTSPQPSVS